ncbi:MAG TPA: MHYT domain-containing protein, partial [Terracidiphilus sp.]
MTLLDGNIAGSYDYPIAALAVCISVLASYTGLDLAERITAAVGMAKRVWLISGGLVLGIGIWSMHYTAMWAFRLPVPVRYDWPTALLSVLIGVGASIIAFFIVSRTRMGVQAVLFGSVLQGGGIASLHYVAMASMRLPAKCQYSELMVLLSILIAVAGAWMSLRLTFFFRNRPKGHMLRRIASAISMGAAISTMHFTGMAAASFKATRETPDFSHAWPINYLGASGILTVSTIVLFGTVITCLIDRLQEKSAQLRELWKESPLPVVVTDEDRRVLRANPEFTRFFGYSTEEMTGRRICDLIAPGELANDLRSNSELALEGQRTETVTVRQRKDGSRVDVVVVSVAVSLASRKTELWILYRDITERKRAENALQAVSSRLLEVQEAERRHLASELHDEVGQLLTGLRLLLNGKRESSVEAIRSRLEQAQSIVDDLLATIRRLSFDLRPADLDQLGLLPALLGLLERYTSQTG